MVGVTLATARGTDSMRQPLALQSEEGTMHKTQAVATRLVVLTALSLFAIVNALAQEAAPIASKLDEYLSAAAKQGFTGSALVARDGKVVFSKGYGMANAELDVPNTPQT